MMMGPEPMIRILRRSVRLGMKKSKSRRFRVENSRAAVSVASWFFLGSACRERKQVHPEPWQILDYYCLAFRESACPVLRADHFNSPLLGVNPYLNHGVFAVDPALSLNLHPPIVRRDDLKSYIRRERSRSFWDAACQALSSHHSRIGAEPLAACHRKGDVRATADPALCQLFP